MERRMMLYLHREATKTWMLKYSNAQHETIITAISNGDADGTATALMDHVLLGKQRMVDHSES